MKRVTTLSAIMTLLVMVVPAFGGDTPVLPFESADKVAPQGKIDELVFHRLQQLRIPPARLCSDEVFVRRVYLDVIGTLPTEKEALTFLSDRTPGKRAILIDQLLARDEYADYWSMKWCDLLRVKSEFPINLWPNAVQAYHQWIRSALQSNVGYDKFARALLTSSGSNFRVPPVNFYRAVQNRQPAGLTQAVALTFMGARTDRWPKERVEGMSAFFAQVGYKSTAEWKEEIVFHDFGKATNAPSVAMFPDGKTVKLTAGQDPRIVLADWLVNPANPWFTRNIANRAWSWLMGRGLIEEPDDIRADNPPVNPQVLAYLEQQLVASRYDLKHLFRLILNSTTYQLSSIPASSNSVAAANFAHYPVRRLEAEVLIDALNQITGTTEEYVSPIPEPFTFIPPTERTIGLADASITSPFLELFGRSPRDTGLESERNNRVTAAQQLHLLNSSHVRRKLEQGPGLRALTRNRASPRDAVYSVYLSILSRCPTADELKVIKSYMESEAAKSRRPEVDLAWALINSPEFLCRH
jgi:hypothetical protein